MLRLLFDLLTLPIRLTFSIALFVLTFIGKGFALMLGIFITLLGIAFSATVIGLIIGIPLIMFGLSMVLSALFG